MKRVNATLILTLLWLGSAGSALAQPPRYSKEAPIWLDFDMESIPAPKSYETGYFYDFANGTIFQQVKKTVDVPRHFRKTKEAYNVNTLDEVPDSSWFTNRNGRRRMSLEEIRRGPNENDGPASGVLTVTGGKTSGITPGFQVRDERGDTYLLKFDPPQYPELASSAEVIATKLFYAIGYNVPQNTVFRFRREQLRVDPKARFTDKLGQKRALTEADVDELLKQAARQPDGVYRCMASKFLKGKPVGNFTFAGVREDDPNDIIPHEHRRDVRALRVFAAWLEHNDIRVGNTLDFYVTEGGRSFVRHYLVDLGSTLGSDTVFPNVPIVGHEYQLDGGEALKVLLSFGLYQQPWLERPVKTHPNVGRYTAAYFEPAKWKQNFPLVAFDHMTERDAYWAAKIVGSFTDEQIQAAVETGELSDPEGARYLAQQISERRDKIVRYYLGRRAALDRFRAEKSAAGFVVRFDDLRAEVLPEKPKGQGPYDYELRSAAEPKKIIDQGTVQGTEFGVPAPLLAQIAQCGRSEADRGVAQLTLRRRGEKSAVQAYLFYDEPRAALRVIGVVQE